MTLEHLRLHDCWTRLLDGEPLSDDDGRLLLETATADSALRADLLDDQEIHDALGAFGRSGRDRDQFVEQLAFRVKHERDAEAFTARVTERAGFARPRRWRPLLWAATAAAAAAAVFVLFVSGEDRRAPAPTAVGPEGISDRAGRSPAVERAGRPPVWPVEADRTASLPPGTVARVLSVEWRTGTVERAGQTIPLRAAADLHPGDVVRLQPSGKAGFALSEAGTLDLFAAIEPAPRPARLSMAPRAFSLESGQVHARLALRRGDEPIGFVTAHARASASRSARFSLQVTDRMTRLEVIDGAVHLQRIVDGANTDVEAGHYSVVSWDKAPLAPALLAPTVLASLPLVDQPDEAGTTLIKIDFEEGVLAPGWSLGRVSAGPPRPGNKYALEGGLWRYGPPTNSVVLEAAKGVGLFKYSPELVLGFDYWAGEEAESLSVIVRTELNPGGYYQWSARLDPGPRQWARATVRLSDFEPRAGSPPLAARDRINYLHISAGRWGGEPLFLDDIELAQYPLDKRPPTSHR